MSIHGEGDKGGEVDKEFFNYAKILSEEFR